MISLSPRVLLYVGIALVLMVALAFIRHHYYRQGFEKAIEKVEQQNDSAVSAARKARSTASECYDAGGLWSTITGECQR